MTGQARTNASLYELLARRWQRSSAIARVCFSCDGSTVAFASRDGTVAVAQAADEEPPEARIHVSSDLGQTVIRPRAREPRPLAATPPLALETVPVAASDKGQILLGCGDGRVVRLHSNGNLTETPIRLDATVTKLDHCPRTGSIFATDGTTILTTGPESKPTRLHHDLGTAVGCLSLSPDGTHLAIAGDNRILVGPANQPGRPSFDRIDHAGVPVGMAWSDAGPWLALALGRQGMGLIDLTTARMAVIENFPAAVRTICWSQPANALIAAGAYRIAGWSMDNPPFNDKLTGALETGRPGLVAVTSVAAHPKRDLVAAGYANGQVVVARIGMRDELVIRANGALVEALSWSPDGRHLALGDADGSAAVVTFPERMFK